MLLGNRCYHAKSAEVELVRIATPLKMELVKRGLLQIDLSMKSGIHPSRICQACNGRIDLSDDEKATLAEVLGLPLLKLFPAQHTFESRSVPANLSGIKSQHG